MSDNLKLKDRNDADLNVASKELPDGTQLPRNLLTDAEGNDLTPGTEATQLSIAAMLAQLAAATMAMQRACEILVSNQGFPDTAGRARVVVDSITGGLTLSSISSVTNMSQLGGFNANDMVQASLANSAGWLRNNITVT